MGWRDHPQYHDAYVWIMKPRRVFEARVNMGSASYPILELTYDGVTLGAYTDLEVGMTLLLFFVKKPGQAAAGADAH